MADINTVSNIRRAIMSMDKPFCLTDLYIRLEKKEITDRGLILRVLDELYAEGLIEYDRVSETVDEPNGGEGWAFRIAG